MSNNVIRNLLRHVIISKKRNIQVLRLDDIPFAVQADYIRLTAIAYQSFGLHVEPDRSFRISYRIKEKPQTLKRESVVFGDPYEIRSATTPPIRTRTCQMSAGHLPSGFTRPFFSNLVLNKRKTTNTHQGICGFW